MLDPPARRAAQWTTVDANVIVLTRRDSEQNPRQFGASCSHQPRHTQYFTAIQNERNVAHDAGLRNSTDFEQWCGFCRRRLSLLRAVAAGWKELFQLTSHHQG